MSIVLQPLFAATMQAWLRGISKTSVEDDLEKQLLVGT
jgi:hypothetical protein